MLMVERSIRFVYSAMIGAGVSMPRKGRVLYLSCPYTCPKGVGVWWTNRKSPEGKRLYNVGYVRLDGKEPELFRM